MGDEFCEISHGGEDAGGEEEEGVEREGARECVRLRDRLVSTSEGLNAGEMVRLVWTFRRER